MLDDPAGLRADLDAAGLAVCSVHAMPAGDQAAAVLPAAATLGTDTVIVPYLPPARFADRASVLALAAELNEIAAHAADQGFRIGYHNHDHELASAVAAGQRSRCSPTPWTTGCCSKSIPTGRRWRAGRARAAGPAR